MGINAILPKTKTENTVVFLYSLFSSEDKLIMAPMQNLTSLFYRKVFERFFPKTIDYAITPFISATSNNVSSNTSQFKDILPQNNIGSIPIVPQVMGNNAEYILNTCKIIENFGYREVNINMGCPKKDIVSRKRGAGMLTEKDEVKKIIETILNNTKLQVSIKVRLGVKNYTDFENLVSMLNTLPLKNICIHPRRAIDFYEGKINMQKFADLCKEIKHTIIYNGDIFCVEEFSKLKEQFPFITHWMIGRGLLQNPFLSSEIRGIHYEKRMLLKKFLQQIEEEFIKTLNHPNNKLVLGKMKEFAKYFCKGFDLDETSFLHSTTLEEINEKINCL